MDRGGYSARLRGMIGFYMLPGTNCGYSSGTVCSSLSHVIYRLGAVRKLCCHIAVNDDLNKQPNVSISRY